MRPVLEVDHYCLSHGKLSWFHVASECFIVEAVQRSWTEGLINQFKMVESLSLRIQFKTCSNKQGERSGVGKSTSNSVYVEWKAHTAWILSPGVHILSLCLSPSILAHWQCAYENQSWDWIKGLSKQKMPGANACSTRQVPLATAIACRRPCGSREQQNGPGWGDNGCHQDG